MAVGLALLYGYTCPTWPNEDTHDCRDYGDFKMKEIIENMVDTLNNLPDCDNRGDGDVKAFMDVICTFSGAMDQFHKDACTVCQNQCSRECGEWPTDRCESLKHCHEDPPCATTCWGK
jgi:hypothetical protein